MNRVISVVLVSILLHSCVRSEAEECIKEFEFGEEIRFKIDTNKQGIVMRQSTISCDLYYVSYFSNDGTSVTERFNEISLMHVKMKLSK